MLAQLVVCIIVCKYVLRPGLMLRNVTALSTECRTCQCGRYVKSMRRCYCTSGNLSSGIKASQTPIEYRHGVSFFFIFFCAHFQRFRSTLVRAPLLCSAHEPTEMAGQAIQGGMIIIQRTPTVVVVKTPAGGCSAARPMARPACRTAQVLLPEPHRPHAVLPSPTRTDHRGQKSIPRATIPYPANDHHAHTHGLLARAPGATQPGESFYRTRNAAQRV